MNYTKLEKFISPSRLNVYLTALSNDKAKSTEVYCHNIQLSEAFYPILSILEVALRNAIDEYMTTRFSDPNWLISQNRRRGYFLHPSLVNRRSRLAGNINFSKTNLRSESKAITHNNILASLPFSFWNTVFDRVHFGILKTRAFDPLDIIFPNLAANIAAPNIYNKVKRIRRFRNRVYHNEPICFDIHKQIDTDYAESVCENIYDVLDWLDEDLPYWADNFDRTEDIFRNLNACLP